jgi:hypothetical protein
MDGGSSHVQSWPRHVTGPWPKLPPRPGATGPPLPADAIPPYEVLASAGFRDAVDEELRRRRAWPWRRRLRRV